MQNAKIFLAEDNDRMVEATYRLLSSHGHHVVVRVSTIEEAIGAIADGQLEWKEVAIAIIDCRLPKGEGQEKVSGGAIIAEVIRRTNSRIKIIAFSTGDEEIASYGDVYVSKFNPKLLLETIASL
jgi:CheY-like chemotaxis protein